MTDKDDDHEKELDNYYQEELKYFNNYFRDSNIRECRFFIEKLNEDRIPLMEVCLNGKNILTFPYNNYDVNSLENAEKIINDSIYLKFREIYPINKYIKETRNLAKKQLVDECFIKSLFLNQRSIFYSWTYLNLATNEELRSFYKNRYEIRKTSHYNDSDNIGNSKKQMINTITKMTDSMTGTCMDKEVLLREINVNYTNAASVHINPFPWISNDNPHECERVFNYLKKTIAADNSLHPVRNNIAIGLCNKIFVHNPLAAIHSLFDIWATVNDNKNSFIKKVKKSWSQAQFRLNQEAKKTTNKKTITINISSESFNKLMQIQKKYEIPEDEIIEKLILSINVTS